MCRNRLITLTKHFYFTAGTERDENKSPEIKVFNLLLTDCRIMLRVVLSRDQYSPVLLPSGQSCKGRLSILCIPFIHEIP